METIVTSNALPQQPCPWLAQVGEGLVRVHERIENACAAAQRSAHDVQLVAVSKTKPAQAVWAAVQHGHTLFGENRVQEALAKMQQVQAWLAPPPFNPPTPASVTPTHAQGWMAGQKAERAGEQEAERQKAERAEGQGAERAEGQKAERAEGHGAERAGEQKAERAGEQKAERAGEQKAERAGEQGAGEQRASGMVEWQMIGHVQTNKAKQLGQGFALLHALDSQRLARALHTALSAQGGNARLPVLLQVNYSAEKSKAGVENWDALQRLAAALAPLSTLNLRGLMCIPPPRLGEKATRKVFAEVRCAAEKLREQFCLGAGFATLSMGMSADLEWAIAEGATLVRVGQAIFGART